MTTQHDDLLAQAAAAEKDSIVAGYPAVTKLIGELSDAIRAQDKEIELVTGWHKRVCDELETEREDVWQQVIAACALAWPDQEKLFYSASPTELIERIIDERDAERTAREEAERAIEPGRECLHCGGVHPITAMYRCFDCNAWLCEDCTRGHMAPGREPHPKLRDQFIVELRDLKQLAEAAEAKIKAMAQRFQQQGDECLRRTEEAEAKCAAVEAALKESNEVMQRNPVDVRGSEDIRRKIQENLLVLNRTAAPQDGHGSLKPMLPNADPSAGRLDSEPADAAAPIANSKSQYKRLVTQGAIPEAPDLQRGMTLQAKIDGDLCKDGYQVYSQRGDSVSAAACANMAEVIALARTAEICADVPLSESDMAEILKPYSTPDWRTMTVSELAAGNPSLKAYSDDLESRVKAAPPVGTLGKFDQQAANKRAAKLRIEGMEMAAQICQNECFLWVSGVIRAEIDRLRGRVT